MWWRRRACLIKLNKILIFVVPRIIANYFGVILIVPINISINVVIPLQQISTTKLLRLPKTITYMYLISSIAYWLRYWKINLLAKVLFEIPDFFTTKTYNVINWQKNVSILMMFISISKVNY